MSHALGTDSLFADELQLAGRAEIPDQLLQAARKQTMTKPEAELQAAANQYGDARLALEECEAPTNSDAFKAVVRAVQQAMLDLNTAARRFATSTRPARTAKQAEEKAA